MKLVLGSQSPRRAEILRFFHLPFLQTSPHFDEASIPFRGNPQVYVQELAKGKADSLIEDFSNSIILTADTIVYQKGKIYGKPNNEEQASRFLEDLSGKWHSVWTGLTLYSKGKYFCAEEETSVLFHSLTDEQKQLYYQSLPIMDKAGAYMIQGAGSLIVQRIEGCYYNVMGLPVSALNKILLSIGIDLWKHLNGLRT